MKKLLILTLAIAVCAIIFPHLFVRAQDQNLSSTDMAARQEQDLAKFFRKHERLKLYTAEVAEQVRNHRPVSIYTPSAAFDIELTLHDMRGRNYRAVEVGADNVERAVEMGPVRTYKGKVLGRDDAQARFTVDDERLEGLIITPEERYMVEPMRKYTASADETDFILYRASDVIKDASMTCAVTMDETVNQAIEDMSPQIAQAQAPEAVAALREIELATEADAEYVTASGGAAQANNVILSILNQVDGVYETELGLTFKIVYQHSWTTASTDPYISTNIVNQLTEFKTWWNANRPPNGPFTVDNPKRDLAHMWTGKQGGAGLAFSSINNVNGVVCRALNVPGDDSYAIVGRFPFIPQEYILTAHEIGHNLSATHNDTAACAHTIMNTSADSNTQFTFCTASRTQITSYVNTYASCLTAPAGCTYTISPTSKSFTSAGGSDRVSVTGGTGCAWTAVSNNTWITITAGGSGTGSGALSYTVAANTATTSRTGTLTVAGKTFTVTQTGVAAPPALSALRLSRSNVPGCLSVTGTVVLTAAAPVGGLVVTLSDNIAATRVPASVTVPEGLTSKTFSITTVPVTANQVGSVTATLGAVTKSAALTVRRIGVLSVSLTPNPVVGPNPVTGTVVLECVAPANGIAVALASTSPAVAAPTVNSFSILAGARSKTFSVRTANVTVSSSTIIKATANAITKTKTLTVN